MHPPLSLICLLLIASSVFCEESSRNWTQNSTGKAISGSYQSQDETHVKLRITGKTFNLKKIDLSSTDQAYLQKISAEENKPQEAKFDTHKNSKCEVPTWHSYLPASYSEKKEKHPVCFLYSAGGGTQSLVNNFKAAADELSWVIIGIDAYSNQRVKANDGRSAILEDCKIIYNEAFKKLNIDKSKVVFSGFSGGGWWSFVSSKNLNKKTAGIIGQGGWMSNQYTKDYPRGMAVAMVNGDKDSAAIKYEQPDGDYLRKKHHAYVKSFSFTGGHTASPAASCLEAARWVHKTKEF